MLAREWIGGTMKLKYVQGRISTEVDAVCLNKEATLESIVN